ncbi:uncharacterized protein LOC120203399 [Hibiscus syriacus]|uniref:uncharacterized protein LOC120203399 n=1 Tax=Hibiscus syriacus TaxID=106335 RepID=UPI0019205E67|nr:uncharacterized protein LOC120203399 [Hibiscus syriacus]
MQPLSTVNQAYSLIVQEESQRLFLSGASGLTPVLDSTALYSSSSSRHGRFNGVCDYCNVRGYKREQCYRLIGYPADFKFTKRMVFRSCPASVSVPWILDTGVTDHVLSGLQCLQNPISCAFESRFVHLPNGSLKWHDEGDW